MWWRNAIFYEIYIRSFEDSDRDGVGDLNGIARRLDYLADLGVDAIWVTPFYPSPQVDFGYDVSNYEDVDPRFGTLADFDRLIAEAHARQIKVVLDVVLNHTSDRHPWFGASRASRSSSFRDWYVWRDGAGPPSAPSPPNNWESVFGGPAWTFDEPSGQWYYHHFYPAQPDLNWRNPLVEERMFAALQFWIDRGVDGFRLDAVNALFEDPDLRDNPELTKPEVTLTGVRTQEFAHTSGLPEVHDALKRLRRFVERRAPECVLISEAYVDDVDELVAFYGEDDEMHMPFNFFLAQVPGLDAREFRRVVELVERRVGLRWPSLVLSNHDIDRACNRYASPSDADQVAKLLATLLLTLRGTPFLYYGEEIGMRTWPPETLNDVRDPVGRTFWPLYKGRDGVRRPMSWVPERGRRGVRHPSDPFRGFSQGVSWLGISPDVEERNVQAQLDEPGSILNFYRSLTRLRRRSNALRSGNYTALPAHPDVMAFARNAEDETAMVVLNMSAESRNAGLQPDSSRVFSVALGTNRPAGASIDVKALRLDPYEALIVLARA
jgi:alpha-glucosidase